MKKFLPLFLTLICLTVILVTSFLKEPVFKKKQELVDTRYRPVPAKANEDTTQFAYHFRNIEEHFKKPLFQELPETFVYREDELLEKHYRDLNHGNDPHGQQIGSFGLAMIQTRNNRPDLSEEEYLLPLENKEQPFVQYEFGLSNMKQRYIKEASVHFKKEISFGNKGNYEEAYRQFIKCLRILENYDELNKHLDSDASKYFTREIKAETYFNNGNIFGYLYNRFTLQPNISGIIAGLLITLVWIFYFTQFKIFLPKNWVLWTVIFVISCLFSELCLILYDFYHFILKFRLDGSFIVDFLYCVFGIGFIEEFTKIIPLLIILFFFRKKIKEPIDLIIIAVVSALGFAFMENLMYFKKYYDESPDIIHRRGMISAVVHIFSSMVVAYGFVLALFRKNTNAFKSITIAFLLATFAHGFFDFWLINDAANIFMLLSYAVMGVGLMVMNSLLTNALNNSPFYSNEKDLHSDRLRMSLITGLSIILLAEYIINALLHGAFYANDILIDNLFTFLILLIFFTTNLSNFNLIRAYWMPLNFTSIIKKDKLSFLLGDTITFQANSESVNASLYPVKGKVVSREVFSGDPFYFRVKLETPLMKEEVQINYVFVRAKNNEIRKNTLQVLYYASLSEIDLYRSDKSKDSLILIDRVTLHFTKEISKGIDFYKWETGWKFIGIAGLLMLGVTFYIYNNYTTSRLCYRKANEFLKVKDFHDAQRYAKMALHYDKDYVDAWMLICKTEFYLQTYDFALQTLEKVFELKPKGNAVMFYVKGRCYYNSGEFRPSEENFKLAASFSDAPDSCYYYLAKTQLHLKKYDAAVTSLNAFMEKHPKHESEEAMLYQAMALYEKRDYQKAMERLNEVIKKNETKGIAYYYRGLCHIKLQNHEAACVDFATAVSNNFEEGNKMINQYCNMSNNESESTNR